MEKNVKEWTSEILTSSKRYAMPIMTFPGAEIINVGILDMVKDGEVQYKCMKALAERYPTCGAVTIMDLSLEAEAFGSPVNFSEGEVPTVVSKIITDKQSAKDLKVPNVGAARTEEYLKAARLASENIKDIPVFGGEIGPFSLAGRLFEMTDIMMATVLEPEKVKIVLEKVTAFLLDFAMAYKNAGADGIIIAEPAAGLLSPEQCDEFSSIYIKRIVDKVQDDNFIVILHNCANVKKHVKSMVSTGAKGYHFGNAVDMLDILMQVPQNMLVFGNVDPARVFKNGSREDVFNETWDLLVKTADYKNFVVSSGCDVPPKTSLENIESFFKAVDKFNTD